MDRSGAPHWIIAHPSGREVMIQPVVPASDSSEKWIPLFDPMP